jgi:hypothetical protein
MTLISLMKNGLISAINVISVISGEIQSLAMTNVLPVPELCGTGTLACARASF